MTQAPGHQPAARDELIVAQQAAEVCPARSIGTESGQRWRRHHPLVESSMPWTDDYRIPGHANGPSEWGTASASIRMVVAAYQTKIVARKARWARPRVEAWRRVVTPANE